MNIEKKAAELQKRSDRNYNIGTKALKPLRVGDKVRVQDPVSKKWIDTGTLLETEKN